jgi:hypothetical protein
MSFFTKAADFAQRGSVMFLLSFFGFQIYQIGSNTLQGVVDSPYKKSTYFKDVEEKVKEEYKKDNVVDSSEKRDWYQANDDSYLKEQVRPNITRPEFKKEYEQQKK